MDEQNPTYEDVNNRLKEIVEAVADDEIDLDNALDLFEEAVALGMKASSMMEEDLAARDALDEEREMQEQQEEERAAQEFLGAPAFAEADAAPVAQAASTESIEESEPQDQTADQADEGVQPAAVEEPGAPASDQTPVLESEDALD